MYRLIYSLKLISVNHAKGLLIHKSMYKSLFSKFATLHRFMYCWHMCSQLISSSICPTSCLLTREKQYMPSICNTSCRRHVYSSTTGCCCRMSICNCLERDVLRLYETHWISSGSDKQGMSMAKIHLSRIASKSCQLLEHALHRLLGGSQLYPFCAIIRTPISTLKCPAQHTLTANWESAVPLSKHTQGGVKCSGQERDRIFV